MKKSIILLALILCGAFFIAGCEYEFVVEEDIVNPGDGDGNGGEDVPISFSTQIVPIFTSRCLDCHDTGGQDPDLSTANAYSSITSMSLVNTTTPESSKLYDFISPSTNSHSWRKYSSKQAALVLKWIQEGAKDN